MDASDLTEEYCLEALKLDPHNPAAHFRLGGLCLERGQFEQAEGHYRSLCQQLPDEGGPLLMLGEVMQLQGRVEEAERSYRQAVAVEPENHLNWTVLGLLHLSQPQNFPQAESCFSEAVRLRPDSASNWQYLGQALLPDRPAEAEAALHRALELEPARAEVHFLIGLVRRQLKAPEAALESFRAALELDDSRAEWWDQLGGLYLDDLLDPILAREALERAVLCQDAEQTYARANLFWACLLAGDLAAARRLEGDLGELDPVGQALGQAALTLACQGQEAAAPLLEQFGEGAELEEDYVIDWLRLKRLLPPS